MGVPINSNHFDYSTILFLQVREHFPRMPIVLVGTKIDLRKAELREEARMAAFLQGVQLQGTLKAAAYFECSARTGEVEFSAKWLRESRNDDVCDQNWGP